jgi:NhaP-type Na+/H+ or K+/H+ antiporter
LIPGAIFVLVGLAVLTVVAISLESHQRNLFLGGTAALLIFVFIFAALLVCSYNRDKRKLKEQAPYRDDHIIE